MECLKFVARRRRDYMHGQKRKKADDKKRVAGYFTLEEAQNIEKIAEENRISCSELMRQSIVMLCNFVERTGFFPVTGPYTEISGNKARQLIFWIDKRIERMLEKLSKLLNGASYSFLIRTAVLFYIKEKSKKVD